MEYATYAIWYIITRFLALLFIEHLRRRPYNEGLWPLAIPVIVPVFGEIWICAWAAGAVSAGITYLALEAISKTYDSLFIKDK